MHPNQQPPLASIIIPAFNREDLIAETINSALAQTYPHVEIIVVDNCSTDNTWQIVLDAASRDPRIRAFRNDRNIGPVRNWLSCLERARGYYTKILWSDDLIHPDFLARALPYLDDPSIGFVYTAARIFSGRSPEEAPLHYSALSTGKHPSIVFLKGSLLGGDFPVSPGCAVLRTEDLRRFLWLHIPTATHSDFERHAIGNDLLIFLLAANSYPKFAFINEALSFFRDHPGSISTGSKAGYLVLHYDMVKAYFAEEYLKDQAITEQLNVLLWFHLKRYDGSKLGLHTLTDFYSNRSSADLSKVRVAEQIAKSALGRLTRRIRGPSRNGRHTV